jgi:hypothetical protein
MEVSISDTASHASSVVFIRTCIHFICHTSVPLSSAAYSQHAGAAYPAGSERSLSRRPGISVILLPDSTLVNHRLSAAVSLIAQHSTQQLLTKHLCQPITRPDTLISS